MRSAGGAAGRRLHPHGHTSPGSHVCRRSGVPSRGAAGRSSSASSASSASSSASSASSSTSNSSGLPRAAPLRARAAAGSAGSSTAAEPQASTSGRPFNASATTYDDDLPHETAYYDYKWGSKINYVRAGRSGPPLLLCHGFGVGSYHFERNIPVLAQDHRVYAVDLLGQGQSWPSNPNCERSGPLRLSADTWTEQLHHFIQERIGEPCYIAGNSLGGYLAVNLAARHPEAVRGLVLLNATPFWSQRPPAGQETGLLWRTLLRDVDATLPVNHPFKTVIQRFWWDRIRQPETIRSLLQLVYARPAAIDDALLSRIVAATERPDALDAFASILLSPRTELSFDEMLRRLRCPVCLAYGREDPWVVPLWGQRLKRTLPEAAYLELSPAGHCVHHEAPAAVNSIIATWIAAVEAGEHSQHELLQVGASVEFQEADGEVVTCTCLEGRPRNIFERWDNTNWQLRRVLVGALQRAREAAGAALPSGGSGP